MSASALPAENTSENRQGRHFPRACRLLAAAQYTEVFATRRAVRGALFVMHYRPNDLAGPRLGLVIPKKQARNAVLRNAVKRQAREIFRARRAGLPALDIVLRLNAPLDKPKRPALAQDRQARAAWRTEMAALFAELVSKVKPCGR